ncbi:Flagellar basal body rod protein [Pseudodesulfovibrio profundus]|uniref:Flagellar basal body rod protein n=1 Tax=Pseudodesulfovibrio profundus TaxID=57320 RepID=A0A2C8F694_9BACT|nr:flagellar basal body rod C-terminal domain-containing protein [Pseudodesulfovibrio profundus]MBC18042.1 flagellar basal body rod protein [Desulfovibrio sp.]SOB57645.1 Flagellar basal body rod protein [Pseudodesulfovibrio profundus]|tara:strand:- start:578 stop:904 length:327 start_codon:yes stop_codon:yes gene_type:complete
MSEVNASALSALSTVQQVSANNIANVNTDGFQPSSVGLETGPEGQGVRVGSINQSSEQGPVIDGVELSNTDLGTEMVDMMTTSRAFSANTAAIRVSEQMTGHLLNMVA